MRVVLSTYGSRGDTEPMVALAVRLRELGADARICAPPDLADLLERAGVPLVPAGRPIRELIADGAKRPGPTPDRVSAITATQYEAVMEAAEGADVVVGTGLMPAAAGARSAADRRGIRYAFVTFQPVTLPSLHQPPFEYPMRPFPPGVTDIPTLWKLDVENMNAIFGPGINGHRESVGLPPLDDVRGHVISEHPWLAADQTLCPWRPSPLHDVVQTGAWILFDDRPLEAELEAFLAAGAPPVYVGFGSMPLHGAPDAAPAAIEAVRAQGRRVLLHRGWAGLAAADGADDCLVIGEVNQQALFRRVAAVVHHGGAGTTATAARAGAPQVIVPQVVDQPYWGRRVAELGIGALHDGPVPTAESLTAGLSTALDPATRARAAEVAPQIRTDGTTVAANLLIRAEG